MTNDLDATQDVLRRALDELAAQLPLTPRGVPYASATPRHQPRTWWIVAGVAAALVVIVTATALVVSNDTTASIQTSSHTAVQVPPGQLLQYEADVIVYMTVDASQNHVDAVHTTLSRSTLVLTYTYVDKVNALENFKQLFRNRPDLTQNITAAALPVEFRLLARNCAANPRLVAALRTQPGVDAVAQGSGLSHRLALRYNNTTNPPELRGRRGRCGQISPTTPSP